jgi:hypothetical protein
MMTPGPTVQTCLAELNPTRRTPPITLGVRLVPGLAAAGQG